MAKQVIPGAGLWSTIVALINGNYDELYHQAGKGWIDIRTSLVDSASLPGTPGYTKFTDDGAGSTGIYARAFDDTVEESLLTAFHIPHGVADTEVYPHVHWSPMTTGTGTVRWGFEWVYARGYSQEAFGSTSFEYLEQAGSGAANSHQVIENETPITLPTIGPDGMILGRLFRDCTHPNDTYVGDAIGLFMDFHVYVDRFSTPNRNYPFG